MKKKKSPVKVVVPLILAVAAAGVGYKVVNRYIPSKEVMDGNVGLLLYEFMRYNQSKIHPCNTVLSF